MRDENRKKRERKRFRENQQEKWPADIFNGIDPQRLTRIGQVEQIYRGEFPTRCLTRAGALIDGIQTRIDGAVQAPDAAEKITRQILTIIPTRYAGKHLMHGAERACKRGCQHQAQQFKGHQYRDNQDGQDIKGDIPHQLGDEIRPFANMQPPYGPIVQLDRYGHVEILPSDCNTFNFGQARKGTQKNAAPFQGAQFR